MAHADNSHHLRLAAEARHDSAVQRTHDAIRTLDRHGQPISLTTVADAAHVSRSWLYRQLELRAIITHHPRAHPGGAIPAAQRATPESNAARLDALRLEIEQLRTENAILREHVARALGQRRAQPEPLRQQHVHNTPPQAEPGLVPTRSR
ncbi:MAG TPA: DUF6262 family protein [Mycobacterium sp.]|nr:DUF6262 family protein [Mycobacterium sp.]